MLVIKYAEDTRYSAEDLSTHDRSQLEALPTKMLAEVEPEAMKYDVIAIDEGQFYPDIVEYAEKWANAGKTIIISALDGTW